MAKHYNSTWFAEKLKVNFNLKQWRQDLAFFIREKKFWDYDTRVTRARAISNYKNDRGIKSFEVYNTYGGSVKVTYQDNNKIINSTDEELIKKYLEERAF